MYRDARVSVDPNGQNVARLAVIKDARVIRRTNAELILFSVIPKKGDKLSEGYRQRRRHQPGTTNPSLSPTSSDRRCFIVGAIPVASRRF